MIPPILLFPLLGGHTILCMIAFLLRFVISLNALITTVKFNGMP